MTVPLFVGATNQVALTNNTDISIAPPVGTQVGDFLLVQVCADAGNLWSVNLPAGWALIRKDDSNVFRGSQMAAYFVHDGSASYTFMSLNGASFARMLSYTNVGAVALTSSSIIMVAANNANTASIAVSASDSLEVVLAYNAGPSSSNITAASGMISRVNRNTFPSIDIADAAVTPTATPVRNVTQSATNQLSVINFVIAGTSGGGGTPVAFTGTIPTQTAVVGEPFSLDLAPYFSGTLTPFTYSIFSGALPEDWTLSGSVISGTSAAPETATIVARATDTGSNTANTNSFDIVVNWAAVPAGTVTIGTITKTSTTATVPYTYSAADQTGFEYRLNGGSPVADAASPVDLTGLTPSTAYTIEVRAVNASGAGTWSAVGNFTTNAAAQVPQGTVTIGSITATQTTASVPYTYSLADQTGFQYRLNGGAATTATASPQSLTGLTAGTAYTIEIRAINATGNGTWSAVANFTTASAITFTSLPLRRLVDGALMANKALTYVRLYNPSTGALVVSKTGLTTNASGVFSFTDASLTVMDYKVDWETTDGEFCMPVKGAV